METAMTAFPSRFIRYELQPAFPAASAPVPTLQRLGRSADLLARLAPALATRLLWRLWFTPQSVPPNPRARELLASVDQRFEVFAGDQGVTVESWGQGPAVLLAHGWSGYGAQLGSLVRPLVQAGYRVLLFDAPGHGGRPRTQFHLGQYAALIEAVVQHAGDVRAIVGHSIGATAAAIAIHRLGRPIDFVGIAASANLKTLLQNFQQRLGFSDANAARLRDVFEAFFGADVWSQYSLDFHLPRLGGRVLLVHDADDTEAALANSRHLQSLRDDAELVTTQSLGHNRLLHDAVVVQRVTRFIARPAALPLLHAAPSVSSSVSLAQ
jgi:pimeloyl-ACP methyl ester carboxylesterase